MVESRASHLEILRFAQNDNGLPSHLTTIDATGIHALEQLCIRTKADGTMIILSGVQRQPFRAIVRGARRGLFERRNFARDFETAVERGKRILAVKSQSSALAS